MKVTEKMMERFWRAWNASHEKCDEHTARNAVDAALDGYALAPFGLTAAEKEALEAHGQGATIQRRQHISTILAGALERCMRTISPKPAEPVQAERWNVPVSVLELLDTIGVWDVNEDNGIVVREMLRQYVEAEAAKLAPATGAEWTDEDYKAAQLGFEGPGASASNPSWFSKARYPRIVAALDAVKHRLAQPVEPLSEETEEDIEYLLKHQPGGESRRVAEELRRRFPKAEPKQRTPKELAQEVSTAFVASDAMQSEALAELVRLAEIGAQKSADK